MVARAGSVKANGTTGTAVKTVWQILAAANHPAKLIEAGISFKGIDNAAEPILVELIRQSNDGTGTAYTPRKCNNELSGITFDTSAKVDYTAEPVTPGDILKQWTIHPQTGHDGQMHDLGEIIIGAGTALALRVTAAADVGYAAYAIFNE